MGWLAASARLPVAAGLPDVPWSWIAAGLVVALLAVLILLLTHAGIRLLAAVAATAPFAAAVLWADGWDLRVALAAVGVLAIVVGRWAGVVVWPDVVVIFLAGLAVAAVMNTLEEAPQPEPLRPAVAAFDLPADRVRPPANELRAPSRIELIALIPKPVARASATTHEPTQFEALLLTPVKRSGASGAVRVLVERGEDDANARDLARATLDASEFVLLPAGDCFVAPRRDDLRELRARALLEAYGFAEEEAKSYVDSFAGPIDFIPVLPGKEFRRYHSGNRIGRFLTEALYRTRRSARNGLALPPENQAEIRQSVRVVAPTMALFGRVKNGVGAVTQYFVLRAGCFSYAGGGVELRKE